MFKDKRGKIIYVGKAKSLRHRVRSYFQHSRNLGIKNETLIREIADIEYIVTDNEVEAVILENSVIKKEKPKFNVMLRDDKNFPYLKLTVNEEYPRLYLVRRVLPDGALYYGPFIPASLARRTMRLVSRHFLIRRCHYLLGKKKVSPCIDLQIHRCLGPCVPGLTTREEYGAAVEDVRLFLKGKTAELMESLRHKMEKAAVREQFEQATYYRDTLCTVEELSLKQNIAFTTLAEEDFFGYYMEGNQVVLQVFNLRQGVVVGRKEYYWDEPLPIDEEEFITAMVKQYYHSDQYVPHKIYLQRDFEERKLLEDWLSQKRGERVNIAVPKKGRKAELLQLTIENARLSFNDKFKSEAVERLLSALQEALRLSTLPKRIEAFDISNIGGGDMVGSMVVWEKGVPKPSDYRKFKIKTVIGPDDVGSMAEIIRRRYERLLREKGNFPDLVLVDGGKGQLGAAVRTLASLEIEGVSVAAIAKREEMLYLPGREEPLRLDEGSPVLHLLQQIRDEAHRFAITFHRRVRTGRVLASELEQIPGIGEKRRNLLLSHFKSLHCIKSASEGELAPLIGRRAAKAVIRHFSSP